jgi:hypothetical protein
MPCEACVHASELFLCVMGAWVCLGLGGPLLFLLHLCSFPSLSVVRMGWGDGKVNLRSPIPHAVHFVPGRQHHMYSHKIQQASHLIYFLISSSVLHSYCMVVELCLEADLLAPFLSFLGLGISAVTW